MSLSAPSFPCITLVSYPTITDFSQPATPANGRELLYPPFNMLLVAALFRSQGCAIRLVDSIRAY